MNVFAKLAGLLLPPRKGGLDLWKEIYGGRESKSGKTVNWQTAIEVATVLAICRVLADGTSQIPFRLYQDMGSSRRVATEKHLNTLVSRQPNSWMTSFEFRETSMFHLALANNAFAFVNRVGIAREIREIVPIEPGRVTVKQLDDYRLEYRIRGKGGVEQVFGQDAIWHQRGPSWNSWMGMDATKLARDAIGLSMALEEGQATFQSNGAKVSGLYSVEEALSPEQYGFLAAWIDKYGIGGERQNKPMILDRGAKFTPFTMTGVDAQLLETRKHQIEEICRAFRVMPIMVGHADKTATYASAEQMFLAHVVHTLMPWYERIEQSANVNLLTEQERDEGYYFKFTANALMRGAAKDRGEFYAKALGAGGTSAWMTPNEVRALEELDRKDGGDELAKPTVNTAAPAPKEDAA